MSATQTGTDRQMSTELVSVNGQEVPVITLNENRRLFTPATRVQTNELRLFSEAIVA
jgi:hypothetical protein